MPSLKGLVDTGKLSIEDALEIDDVARQNNWSDETVKQFHKSAVEGLGIQNKDTASLEQMLVTAKVKEVAYKQNAEKYKQVVGKNIERVRRWRNALNNEGYQVYLHLIDLSPEKATRRAVERFQNTGRFVDPNYVLNLGLIPSKNYDILKQEKGWVGYEKYSIDVERGQPPALIERGGELSADAGRPLRLSRRGLSQGIGEDSQEKTKESSTAEVVPPKEVTASQTNIQQPNIRLMPSLKGLVDTGKLSINVPLSNVNKWEKAIKKGNLLYSVAQKPAKEVAPSSPGNNIISPPPESVKPDIQLMPSLKGLVDTGKLSIEDALEIDDVARQNNWSDETVKQFHKSAVEGLGIQNKDTAALEQMLVTAKVKVPHINRTQKSINRNLPKQNHR